MTRQRNLAVRRLLAFLVDHGGRPPLLRTLQRAVVKFAPLGVGAQRRLACAGHVVRLGAGGNRLNYGTRTVPMSDDVLVDVNVLAFVRPRPRVSPRGQ